MSFSILLYTKCGFSDRSYGLFMQNKEKNYERILEVCRSIDFPALERVLFTLDAPLGGASHFMPRLNILLRGRCVFQCFHNSELQREILEAPAIYYCSQNGYQVLDQDDERESLSFCYNADHIRLVLYSPDRRLISNTSMPLTESGKKLIGVIEQLWRENERAMARRLLNELFSLTVKSIQKSNPDMGVNSNWLWRNIITYINTHPGRNITRSGIAKRFGISPGYVSKLARKHHNSDFVSVLNEFKLGHAAMLLVSSDMSIPEIAESVGFKYTSYFFRSFRKHYQMTPKEYRQKNR